MDPREKDKEISFPSGMDDKTDWSALEAAAEEDLAPLEASGETRESEYRRGYYDGFLSAAHAFFKLTELPATSTEEAYRFLREFWTTQGYAWMLRGQEKNADVEWPPKPAGVHFQEEENSE